VVKAGAEGTRTAYTTVVGKPAGRRPLDIGVDGRIILTCLLKKQVVRDGMD
jgi:hypothetical protein